MAKSSMIKLSFIAIMCIIILTTQHTNATLSCGQVSSQLATCVNYLKGSVKSPVGPCCGGVKRLNGMAKTTPDRQTACNCLKSLAGVIAGIKDNLAAGLPSKCGVSIPYPIAPNTDCSKVH